MCVCVSVGLCFHTRARVYHNRKKHTSKFMNHIYVKAYVRVNRKMIRRYRFIHYYTDFNTSFFSECTMIILIFLIIPQVSMNSPIVPTTSIMYTTLNYAVFARGLVLTKEVCPADNLGAQDKRDRL